MKPTHARKVIRARASRDALRAILPQDIGWGLAITRGDNIFFRGVLAARFTRDGSHITTDRHSAPIAMTDSRALTAHFRGFFFPADYTDAMTAYDRHEELRAAYAAGDDAAVTKALKALDALKAPVAVA